MAIRGKTTGTMTIRKDKDYVKVLVLKSRLPDYHAAAKADGRSFSNWGGIALEEKFLRQSKKKGTK